MKQTLHISAVFDQPDQHFVDDEDLRFEVGGYGKTKPYIHAAAVAFDRRINKLTHAGEGYDLVELAFDLGAFHAEDGAIHINVFTAGEARDESLFLIPVKRKPVR